MPQNIGQIIGQYQAALDAEQVSTTRLLLDDYSMALPRLKEMQNEIIEKIEEDKRAGKKVSKAAILRRTDFQRMTKEVELEMERLAGVLQGAIGGGQPAMAQAGVDMAERLVTEVLSPLPEAAQASIMATFNRMPREAVEALSGALSAPGSPLSDLLATFGEQSAVGIQQAMLANLISGRNPRTMAREMNKAWGVPLNRAMTIARTEQLRAYRHGTAGSYRANAHIVKGWKWHAHLGGTRTCMGCLALHGTEFPIEETLDDHPNGRCAMVPVTPSWAELGLEGLPETRLPLEAGDGERWFVAQPEAVQLDMMGPGKLDAWKAGQYEFSRLAKETYDARWGRAFVERPLKELVGDGGVTEHLVALDEGAPAALLDRYGYRPATKAERVAFLRAVDQSPSDVAGLYKQTEWNEVILAVSKSEPIMGEYENNWIRLGYDSFGTGAIPRHEFYHHVFRQPEIRRALTQYRPSLISAHAALATRSAEEDIASMLLGYSANTEQWVNSLVRGGDIMQGGERITEQQARGKVAYLLDFMKRSGLWPT